MSEVDELADEVMETPEAGEEESRTEEPSEDESVKGGSSSPAEIKKMVDIIEIIRKVLSGEAPKEALYRFYEES